MKMLSNMLKYDQWYHHWACVLTALQKCKAESDYYYYYYYYKLLTYHTEIPDFPPQWTGIGFVQEISRELQSFEG